MHILLIRAIKEPGPDGKPLTVPAGVIIERDPEQGESLVRNGFAARVSNPEPQEAARDAVGELQKHIERGIAAGHEAWKHSMPPSLYLAKYPDGKSADLARFHVEIQERINELLDGGKDADQD